MDIRKILSTLDTLNEGSMARAKKKPTGPKFPGYLKGTDPASLTRSRMVGSSESQETVLKDLERELVEGSVERRLREQFANFNEFRQTADDGDDGIDENTLKHLAAQWWNRDEDPRIERTLMSIGWEIGRDEGYDNGGAFVIQAGDENGNSYISWPAEELEGLTESRDLCNVCGQTPCNCTHVAEEKKKSVDLPPPENARKTQIAGTLPTYKKAADILAKTGVKGKSLDFGAGLGHGTKELGKDAHSYEPFPGEKFKPHFVDITEIPDNSYHKIVNLNVLNVVPNAGKQRIRDNIVRNIGRVLAPGGVAIITTRGKDVLTIKGTPGEEPMSMISKIGTYQKGFTASELQEYVQDLLGDEFTVSKIKLGPAGIMIKKSENIDEDWRSKLAGAALAGTMALGAGGAHARVGADYVDNPEINRLTGKPKVTQVEPIEKQPADVATVKKAPGYSAEYLKSVIDGTHPRPLISKERAQELLQQQQQPTNEADDDMFAPSDRAADEIAASKWRRGGEMTGTSLKGYIETTYEQLKSVFGDPYYGPNDTDADKITCEWLITFRDGKVATIYDWKVGETPLDVYDWHIGGSSPKVVDYIKTLMAGRGTIKSSLWESVGATVDLTKNYSNYNSVKGQVIEVTPKGRLKIRITTADIDAGKRAAVRVGDVVNVASNYVKKGMSEDGAMEARIHNPKRVNVYYKPYPDSRHSRVVAENIPTTVVDALINKLSEKFDVNPTDFVWKPIDEPYGTRLNETADEYVIFVNGKPAAKYRSLHKADDDARLLQSKYPDAHVEIKHEVCTMEPVEEEQIDEVGMTTGGLAGMTGGGTPANQNTQTADPAQAAKDLTVAQQNLNKLKSAGIAIPTGVSQAAKTVVGVTNNPTAPQTPADRKTTGALGQGLEQLLAKGDPGQVNQLAAMIKKVQQGGPQ